MPYAHVMKLLTQNEIATRANVPVDIVRQWIEQNELEFVNIGSEQSPVRRVTEKQWETFLKSRESRCE